MSIVTFACTVPVLVLAIDWFLFVRRSGFSRRTQLVWLVWLVFCLSRFAAFKLVGGDFLFPNFPEPLVWFWGWAYSGALLLAFVSCVWWVRKGRRVLLPVAAWLLAAWGLWEGVKVPAVREVEVACATLPAELDGYRIVQISDLHCSTAARRWRTEAVVKIVNELRPDLICLTGDFVDGRVEVVGEDLRPLGDLRARDGVFAVTGNHEYSRAPDDWRQWYRRQGWRFLSNECVFPRPSLALAGVEDPCTGTRPGGRPADVVKALAAATNGEFRVLLEHRPVNARANFRATPVDLQLSGHTHGGIAPLLRSLIALANDGFVAGLYPVEGGQLYVTHGAGQWAGFPVRLFVSSEITVLKLRKRESK